MSNIMPAQIHLFSKQVSEEVISGNCCAFGVFDGVHRGHMFLLESTKMGGVNTGTESVVLTFDKDPDELFRPKALRMLLSNEERLRRLSISGVDHVVVLPFDHDLAALAPQSFLDKVLKNPPIQFHVGVDIRFGSCASGGLDELKQWSLVSGCTVHGHELELAGNKPITSTRIRNLLDGCRIEEANELLGHLYFLEAPVVEGRGEGADLGFRTANLFIEKRFKVIGDGVYAAYAEVEGRRFKAAVSIGVSPVFADRSTSNCEVHLLDYTGDLYGCNLKVEFTNFLRPLIKFDTVDDLVATVTDNINWVRSNL